MTLPLIINHYADPVWVTTAGIFDCDVQFAAGKQVVFCSNPDQELMLGNPPTAHSPYKEVWIKNMLHVPLNVTSYGPKINNSNAYVLQGSVSGFEGESVHLIWSGELNRWISIK